MKKVTDALLKRAWKAGEKKRREFAIVSCSEDPASWTSLETKWRRYEHQFLVAMREMARVLLG